MQQAPGKVTSWKSVGVHMISDEQKRKMKEKAIEETKRFIAIALYIWVFLVVLELHRFAVLREVHVNSLPGHRFGFAAINALMLGKVILIGQVLHVGHQLNEKRLIHAVLFKSAIFALLLICFEIVEEVIVGLIHGKSLAASIPQFWGGGLEGILLAGLMAFVALIPFFLFTEVQSVIGRDKLRSLIFQERSKPAAGAQPQAPAA